MVDVVKLPLINFIGIFLGYLITHIMIGRMKAGREKRLATMKDPPQDLINNVKTLTILFKWYPAIFLIIAITILYAV